MWHRVVRLERDETSLLSKKSLHCYVFSVTLFGNQKVSKSVSCVSALNPTVSKLFHCCVLRSPRALVLPFAVH